MTDEKKPDDVDEDVFKQLQDMLKSANVKFAFGPEGAQAQPAPGGEEQEPVPDESEKIIQRIQSFNLRPREVRDYLDRFVIKQAEAKKVLSVAICDHYNHVRQCIEHPDLKDRTYNKPNIILMGPTGVGKTYLMRCVARLIGVPFVKADATKFSETGYVGYDVEDIVRDLVKMADGNTELAQYGIVYVDEIDKIAAQANVQGKDVSGRGVQVNLLKLMEETEVNLFSQTDILGQMQAVMDLQRGKSPSKRTINTRHILFIVSGAFDRLTEVIMKRMESSAIGFRPEKEDEPEKERDDWVYLKNAEAQDFIRYGYEPEFIGRLPIRVSCQPLATEDLEEILLKSEDSILEQYRNDFRGYGIEFDHTREAIHEVARLAHEEKTGARGLMTVLERAFREAKFELPSTSIKSFEVTRESIRDPAETLKSLLVENREAQQEVLMAEVGAFADRFKEAHGIQLEFDKGAIDMLVRASLDQDKTIRAICEEKFKDFQYGLKLIAGKTGEKKFTITWEAVANPDRELSRWVVEHYPKA